MRVIRLQQYAHRYTVADSESFDVKIYHIMKPTLFRRIPALRVYDQRNVLITL